MTPSTPDNTTEEAVPATPAHPMPTASATLPVHSTPSEEQEQQEGFSLSASSEKYLKPIVNSLKVILALPLIVLGFPWLYAAAYFVESKEAPDYSWSEVGWRSLGGVGFWTNGIVLYVVLVDRVGSERKGYLTALLGYCLGMGLLIVIQAFYGRWYEEKERGAGHKAAKLFWRHLLSLFRVKTEEVVDNPTAYVWAFSLVAIMSSLICLSIVEIYHDGNLIDWHPVRAHCEYLDAAETDSQTCSFDASAEEPSVCGPGLAYAIVGQNCLCCKLMVNKPTFFDMGAAMGGSVVVYYGILKVFAAFCVWAEEKIIMTEATTKTLNRNATSKADHQSSLATI